MYIALLLDDIKQIFPLKSNFFKIYKFKVLKGFWDRERNINIVLSIVLRHIVF